MIRIILGPPCAGKSTFIAENAVEGDLALEFDGIAAAVDAAGHEDLHADREAGVLAAAAHARASTASRLASDWKAERDDGSEAVAWVATTGIEGGWVEALVDAGGTVTLLDPGMETCLERCAEDDRPLSVAEAIREWYADPPQVPAGWIHHDNDNDGKEAPTMRAKNLDMKVKAVAGEHAAKADGNLFGGALEEGDFIAYASTFHEDPDSYGDIIEPGAFAKTLADWAEKDAPIPLLYGHDMHDPEFNIGHIVDAKEDETGLLVWGRLDLEMPKAAAAYRLIKSRRVNQLSFAFDILDAEEIRDEKDEPTGGLLLKELALHEVSLVQLGANRHTSVLAVKSAADAVVSARGEFTEDEAETLRETAAVLRDALANIEGLLDRPGEGAVEDNENNQPGNDEDARESAEPTEPKGSVSARVAAASLALALTL